MLITNFSSGELSPLLYGRTDLQQYYQGAASLINFDIIPTGGIQRRKGTKRISKLADNARLIPMILDKTTSFIFEVAPKTIEDGVNNSGSVMKVWKNGSKMLNTAGSQITIEAPWSSLEEIKEIQYAQNYDTMIFVQHDTRPFEVKYNIGSDTFTSSVLTFDFTPDVVLDDEYDYIWRWPGVALPSYNIDEKGKKYTYLIYHGLLYYWNHNEDYTPTSGNVQVYWEVDTSATEYTQDSGQFTETSKYPGSVAFFNSRLYFASTINEQQKVWASAAPDVSGNRYTCFNTYTKYVTVNKVVKDPDIHFFSGKTTEGSNQIQDVSVSLKDISNITDYFITGDCFAVGTKVVEYNDTLKILTLNTSATSTNASMVFTVQLWQSSTSAGSADYNYKVVNENMTSADDAFYFEVASDQNDAIKWLATSKYLVIGTESANYVCPSGINALDIQASMDGRYGTDDIQATTVQTAVVFFSQGKKSIREYYYSAQQEAFQSNDIALIDSEILKESKAIDFDFVTNPYSKLIITKEDGSAATLLYEKSAGILAWSRIESTGKIQSVATTRGDNGTDLIYMVVKHGEDYFLELLDSDQEVYLDSWCNYSTADYDDYTDDATVYNLTTGKYCKLPDITDDFVKTGESAVVGYTYTSLMKSMPIIKNDPTEKKRITNLIIRFYNSFRPIVEVTPGKTEKITNFTEPYTGVKQIVYPGDSDRDVQFTLSIDNPYSCNILAINASLAS